MNIHVVTLPSGEETVTMSRADYEDLIDARDHAIALRDRARIPIISDEDMDAYLAAPSALQFWRKHRGMLQRDLAAAVGISSPYLAQIEHGKRVGTTATYVKLARTLDVRVEDLLPDQMNDMP